jgi:hypothetical protein
VLVGNLPRTGIIGVQGYSGVLAGLGKPACLKWVTSTRSAPLKQFTFVWRVCRADSCLPYAAVPNFFVGAPGSCARGGPHESEAISGRTRSHDFPGVDDDDTEESLCVSLPVEPHRMTERH